MSNNFTYCECEVGTCQGADIEWCANKTVPSIKELARLRRVEAEDREKVAQWMISLGLATGHGDTVDDLLSEAGWQVTELQDRLKAALEEGV